MSSKSSAAEICRNMHQLLFLMFAIYKRCVSGVFEELPLLTTDVSLNFPKPREMLDDSLLNFRGWNRVSRLRKTGNYLRKHETTYVAACLGA